MLPSQVQRSATELSGDLRATFRGHPDRIALAVLDTIKADRDLVDWIGGEHRIFRVMNTGDIPAGDWPLLVVHVQSVEMAINIGASFEVTVPVSLTLLYDEFRGALGDDELSESSFALRILQPLVATGPARNLRVARFSNAALVDTVAVQRIDVGEAMRREDLELLQRSPDEEVDYVPSGLALQVVLSYTCTLDRATLATAELNEDS